MPLVTPGYLKQNQEVRHRFRKDIIRGNVESVEHEHFSKYLKNGRRQVPTACLITSWTSWIWEQNLPEKYETVFGLWESWTSWIWEQNLPEKYETVSGLWDN